MYILETSSSFTFCLKEVDQNSFLLRYSQCVYGIRVPFHDLEDMKLAKINMVSNGETTVVHQAAPCHSVKTHS